MLVKDSLGRLRHQKYVPTMKVVECYTCGLEYKKYGSPLTKIKDTNNYFCKLHAKEFGFSK